MNEKATFQNITGWDNNLNSTDGDQSIPVHLFPKHVSELHMDQVK